MTSATERRATTGIAAGKGDSLNVKALCATIELASATAAGATVEFGYIPTNARVLGVSTIYWDVLSTAAATLDLGLKAVDANITSDDDAFTNGLDVTSAGSASALSAITFNGVPAWDLVNGQTSDPGGTFIVQGTIKDQINSTTATVTLDLLYYLD